VAVRVRWIFDRRTSSDAAWRRSHRSFHVRSHHLVLR
jgi:hypothetical protein